jgi:transcriptional regulator with XRE-family HTH domain
MLKEMRLWKMRRMHFNSAERSAIMGEPDFAQRLIVLRGSKGWTQQELALALGTTQRTVASWESGASLPRKAMRVRIAQVFSIPPDEFLQAEDVSAESGRGHLEDVMRKVNDVLADEEYGLSAKVQESCMSAFRSILSGDESHWEKK